jgi:C4-dicarboxylate transporter DctM subunit
MVDASQSRIHKGMERLGKGVDRLSDFLGALAGVFIVICAGIVFWEVIARRLLHQPTIWEPDITIYLMIWFGSIAAAFGLKQGSHVYIDIVVTHLAPRVRALVDMVAYFFVTFYAAIFTRYAVGMTISSFQIGETGFTELRAPIGPVKLGLALGMAIFGLQALRMFISKCYSFYYETRNLNGEKAEVSWASFVWVLLSFAALLVLGVWFIHLKPLIGIVFLLFTLLAAGIPVGFSLGLVGCVSIYLLFGGAQGLIRVPVIGFSELNSFTLVALPLFVFAGQVMQSGGLADKIFDTMSAFVGHLPGGLGIATIGACAIFAAISGSSVANAATIGLVAIPALIRRGYDKKLAYGMVAAGGTLGILIPPSNQMILYALVTEESLGHLFMAGVIPGIILAMAFASWAVISCKRSGNYSPELRVPWKQKLRTLKNSSAGLAMPIIILGLIYTGTVTPTEAAAVAVVYAVVFSVVYRTIKWRELFSILAHCTKTMTMIFMIIIGAVVLGNVATMLNLPQVVVAAVSNTALSNWFIIVILMAFLIVLGCVLEPVSITLLFVPVAAPLIEFLGFDLIWFAVLLTLNMEMALITPPVGTNLYVVQQVAEGRFLDVVRGVIPFLVILALGLVLIGLIPQLSLWLPSTMK